VTNPTWRVTLRDEAIEWLERELRFYLHEVNPTQQMRDPDPSRSRARRSPGLRMPRHPPHPRTMTAARAATDALTLALINLAARGLRTHCSNPGTSELWVSDHEAERVAVRGGVPPLPPLHRGTRNGGNTYELMPSLRFSGSRRDCRTWRGHG
jgi:hypothetical protein